MSAVVEQILEDEWPALYGESWTGVITPEAFAHPAKFSRALIRKIYNHVMAEGWAAQGDRVADPFGGVALGAFEAMQHGLNWYGCELEAKFHGLGNLNINLWNERFSRMPKWGTATLLNGDSRKLAEVLRRAECCVSSPPYVSGGHHTDVMGAWNTNGGGHGVTKDEAGYGYSEGQIGAMKEGDLNLVVSSPPYVAISPEKSSKSVDYAKQYETYRSSGGGASFEKFVATQEFHSGGYGNSDGQLSAMKSGSFDAAITSPPYNPPMSQDHNGSRGGQRGTTPSEKGAFVKYGSSEGQLEGMSMEGFDVAVTSPPFSQPETRDRAPVQEGSVSEFMTRAYTVDHQGQDEGNLAGLLLSDEGFQAAVSSPPYEGIQVGTGSEERKGWRGYTDHGGGTYASEAQLSAQTPETFWSASRLILEQLYQVITPGGHAVFVVKAFVRDKQIVDFPAQWARVCEAVGFRLVHHHRALLVEHSATQGGFEQDKEIKVERKSFFRRLAEKKGSPRIDWESVLCFERP